MDKLQLREWLKHPISIELVDSLKEDLKANEETILGGIWKVENIDLLNRLRGHLETLHNILDFDQFFVDKIKKEEVVKDDDEA